MFSGFEWEDLEPCVEWMAPFARTHMDEGSVEVKFFQSIPAEDSHNVQIHAVDLNMLVSVGPWAYCNHWKESRMCTFN